MKINLKNFKQSDKTGENKHKYRLDQELKTNCDKALLRNLRECVSEEGKK